MRRSLVNTLPFAELHVHIEGALRGKLVFEFANRNGIQLPYCSPQALSARYNFKDLQTFLNLYYNCSQVLVTEADFHDLMVDYLQHARQDNVRHAEVFFDPQAHMKRGIRFETVIEGLSAASVSSKEKFGVSSKLILCFLRDMSEDSAMDVLTQALRYRDHFIGVGLDSKELGSPPSKFQRVFARARAEGLRCVAHAGEEAPPEYIWQALDLLFVDRVDHGYSSLQDVRLVHRLIEHGIPLTCCPFACVRVRYFKDIAAIAQAIKTMLDLGICASCHSDDPAYFGGYFRANLKGIHQAGQLSDRHLALLAHNSFQAAFIDDSERSFYQKEVADAVYAAEAAK